MSEQYQVIQKFGKFFGWIAGVTAGVSVLLSIAGFMLLQSHAHLLGVSGVFHHTVEDYLYQGGNFFIATLFWALPASIIVNSYIWIAAGIIAIYLLGRRLQWFGDLTQRLNMHEAFQQSWVQWIAIIAAVLLFWLIFINHELSLVEVNDLLFVGHSEITNRVTLEGQYATSVLYIILSALILWGINRIYRDPEKKFSGLLLSVYNRLTEQTTKDQVEEKASAPKGELTSVFGRLFLYLLFLVQLVLLPVQYGKTVYPNSFHQVSNLVLDDKYQGTIPRSENIYFLNERDEELILYFSDTQEVLLLKKESILNITLKARKNPFEK